MNKKFIKKTWPLWCIIPFIVWVIVAYVITPPVPILPEDISQISSSGAMVEYNEEWIGGNIVGENIILTNGTEMNFNEFKRITGFNLEE